MSWGLYFSTSPFPATFEPSNSYSYMKYGNQINVTRGNDIELSVLLTRDGEIFPVALSYNPKVSLVGPVGQRTGLEFTIDEETDRLLITILARQVTQSVYGLEITGVLNGSQWRSYFDSLIRYTVATRPAPQEHVQQEGDRFDVTMDVQMYKGMDTQRMEGMIDNHNEDPDAHGPAFSQHNRDTEAHARLLKSLKSQIEENFVEFITYANLKNLRDNSQLLAGRFYRITDYETTTMQNDTQSAGHPFDVVVLATSPNTLSERALALHNTRNNYFQNARLEAWELKYCLDNVQWSNVAGTYCVEDMDNYSLQQVGTVNVDGTTYILWKGEYGLFEDYGVEYAVSEDTEEGSDLWKYDPDTQEIIDDEWNSSIMSVSTITEDGKGTILWMKDEFGNECPYDFKNIMFKRWLITDQIQGREGLDGKYLGVLNNISPSLLIDDEEAFIWAYTFSSDSSGEDEQEDYSLDGKLHNVFGNVFKEAADGTLPNNVMYGEYNYGNKFGYDCKYNSWGNSCGNNSWGNSCYGNSWGNDCNYNSWGNNCFNNSWGNNCYNNSWGNNCYNNSWGNEITYSTVFDGVQYTQITTTKVKYIQVLNGVAGSGSNNKLTLSFTANVNYTQVACKNSSNQLIIVVPGNLV